MDDPSRSRETADAEKVNEALQEIGARRFGVARRLLEEVAANVPDRYEREFTDGDARVIKFWDRNEFTHYVTLEKKPAGDGPPARNIVWQLNAYPRAYYYLAFLAVEDGDFARSLEFRVLSTIRG